MLTPLPLMTEFRTAPGLFARPPAGAGFLAETDGVRKTYLRDEAVYAEEETADWVYEVVTGVVRTCRLLSDGRRQIEDFHLCGDVFGLEAGLTRRTTAEAVGPVVLKLVRRSILADLAARDPAVAQKLWSLTAQDLRRSRDHVLMLGRRSAVERVAGFLLDLVQRTGCGGDALDLPMSRQDIADYLGLTIETVSRTFTQLQGSGVLKAPSCRHLEISLEALENICA